jgi:O-antigen ligase
MNWLKLAKYLVFILCIGLSLFAGQLGQNIEPGGLIYIFGLTAIWILAFILFKPSVTTTLLFIAVYSLKPSINGFYLCLGLLSMALIMEQSVRDKLKLIIPYPVLMVVLLAAGIQAILNAIVFAEDFVFFATTIIVPLVSLFTVANSVSSEKDLENWSRFIVAVAFILGLIGIVMAINNPLSRLGSLWVTAMNINGFYLMAFFLAIGLILLNKHVISRYLIVFLTIIIFLGMLYTYTRITLLAVGFGLFLLSLKIRKLKKLAFLFILLTPLLIPSSMITRIQMGFTSDVSLLIRVIAWYHALIQISRNFLFGIGFNTWKHIYSSWVPYRLLFASHPHNVYLRVMVETGIFGFLAYFGLIVAVLSKYYRFCVKPMKSKFDFAVFVAICSVLFACITDVFIQQFSVSLPFWITLALMYKKAVMSEEKVAKIPYG